MAWHRELGCAGKVVALSGDVGGEILCDINIDLEGPQQVFNFLIFHDDGLSL